MRARLKRCAMAMALAASAWLAPACLHAQSGAVAELLGRARTQDQAGHTEIAAQSWKQVLLSDPKNREALAGLARWAKFAGNDAEAKGYLDRLRQIDPQSAEIAKVEGMSSSKAQAEQLQQATRLAQAGHPEDAMRIYRGIWAGHPPDGDWALAYYDTEASTGAGRGAALEGLRALVKKYPGDSRYNITLGRILTYQSPTRAEGERLLQEYPKEVTAQRALREALGWDAQNPEAVATIRAYLKEHPDEQLERSLSATEAHHAETKRGVVKDPAEGAAFAALATNHVDEAQTRFMAMHEAHPEDPRALAGLGFVRMKQNDFAGAIGYMEQAKQKGMHDRATEDALKTSRFWLTMQQATAALNAEGLEEAEAKYKAALAMRPTAPEAIEGLSGVYMKGGEPVKAIPLYLQIVKARPKLAEGWRGLFTAQVQATQWSGALETAHRLPPAVGAELNRDPGYLKDLASAYGAMGQTDEAQKTLTQALALPFPKDGSGMKAETRMQFASLLVADKRYAQAAGIYKAIIQDDPDDVSAWQGLIGMQHQTGHDVEAVETVERMAPGTYENALEDSGFLSLLAGIYQQQNHLETARQFLQRAARVAAAKGQPVPVALQLQMAAIYLQQNNAQQAYVLYRGVLMEHPERAEGWKGLLATLHLTHRDRDALAQIQQIPADVRKALENDVDYEQTVATVYAVTGNQPAALQIIGRIQARYRAQHAVVPSEIEIQDAWLLFNAKDDRDLYRALMGLGDREDMTDEQRRTVQTIWASWSVRRAGEAVDAGNAKRSMEILSSAALAFPDNADVSKALAGGYLKAGDPKRSLAIYASLDLSNASAADYPGMIGAALAVPNMHVAEQWLREGLERFPNDSEVLAMAARFEQARGYTARAAEYWKASISAMPTASPTQELAHLLDRPEGGRSVRGVQGTDLADLLNPENEGVRRVPPPPLPGYQSSVGSQPVGQSAVALYGADPLDTGAAPVMLNGRSTGHAGVRPDASETAETDGALASVFEPPVMGVDGTKIKVAAATQSGDSTASAKGGATLRGTGARSIPRKVQGSEGANHNSGAGDVKRLGNGDAVPRSEVRPLQAVRPAATAEDAFAPPHGFPVESRQDPAADQGSAPQNPAIRFLSNSSSVQQGGGRAGDLQVSTGEPVGFAHREPMVIAGSATVEAINQQAAVQQATVPRATVQQGPPAVQAQQQGASDEQLQQRNLPPLRGPWSTQPVVRITDPRQEAQRQLAMIEGGYSPWVGGTGYVSHRSGTAGFDALTMLEAPFEVSTTLGSETRLTAIVTPSFLNSGASDGSSLYQLGTAAVGATTGQMLASGVGGEVQLRTANFGVGAGTTPQSFPVPNIIGRANWRPGGGAVTFSAVRDAVKDSQLSYSGLHDPGSASASYPGAVWGGVVSTAINAQYGKGDALSGYYAGLGGQYITGRNVESNDRIDGVAGAYFRALRLPDTGNLTIGVNFFGMHYDHNLRFFTFGQGGYFSPDIYFLANVPFTFAGHYGVDLHYTVSGALGIQAFQEDASLYFPLHADVTMPHGPGNVAMVRPATLIPTIFSNPSYPSQLVVGSNYDLHAEMSYHLIDKWFVGGFLSFNNTRDYSSQTAGFFIRYLMRPQYPDDDGPTGLFPYQGFRPVTVP